MSSWPPLWPRDLQRFGKKFQTAIARFLPDYEFQVGPTPEPGSDLAAPLAYQGRSLGYVSVSLKPGCSPAPDSVLALWPRLADSALENLALHKALQKDPDSGLYNRRYFMARLKKILRSGTPKPGTMDLTQVLDGSALTVAVISLGRGKPDLDRRLAKSLISRGSLCLARLDRDRLGLIFRSEPEQIKSFLFDFRQNLTKTLPHLQPAIGYARCPQDLSAFGEAIKGPDQLVEKAEMALFFAASLKAPSTIIGFGELTEKYGHITQVLPQERVVINLGRAMGARAGQIYAVEGSSQEPKGEITVFETADNYSLATVTSGSQFRLTPGDGLIFSRLDLPEDLPAGEDCGPDGQENEQRNFLDTLINLANLEGNLIAAIISIDDKEKLETLAGPEEMQKRLEKIKAVSQNIAGFKAASVWDRGTVAAVWSMEAAQIPQVSQTMLENTDFPVSLGLVSWPSLILKPEGLLAAAKKALLEASMTGPTQAIVFGPQCLNISGDHFFEDGDLAGAKEEYLKGLILDPNHLNLLNSLGVCHGRLGDHLSALDSFDAVLNLDPENIMALFNKGCSLIMAGRLEEAEKTLALAAKLKPTEYEILYQYGCLALDLGHLEEALPILRQAADLKERRGTVYRLLGQAELLSGDQKSALEAFKKAVKYNPDDAPSLSSLGVLFLDQANDREVALSLFQRSVEIDPTNSLFRQRLGKLLFESGDFVGAKHHLKAAIDYGCRVPEVYKHLEELKSSAL